MSPAFSADGYLQLSSTAAELGVSVSPTAQCCRRRHCLSGEVRHFPPAADLPHDHPAYSVVVEPAREPTSAAPVRITLISRPECHLCDAARAVIERVAGEAGVGWREICVDLDPALLARYSEQVPVTLVDGRQHDYWRVDGRRLRSALDG